jgi:hypothetical protein
MLIHLIKGTLFATLTLVTLSVAQASHKSVTLGPVQLGGSCKDSPVSTRTNRSTGHFIVAPENYVAVIEGNSTLARKTCQFSIPFEGKPNRAVRLRLPKVMGAVALDQGSTADLNYVIFFAGLIGEKTILSYTGQENILETEFNETSTTQEVVYECGKSGIIRGNSSILVRNANPSSHVALAQIQKFGIKIDSVPCQ